MNQKLINKYYRIRQRLVSAGAPPILVIGSAHKVGSTWLANLLSTLYRYPLLKLKPPSTGELTVDIPLVDLFGQFQQLRYACIHKTHTYPPSLIPTEMSTRMKFVTIVRDPRDVIVSAAHYLANLDQSVGGWGPEFASMTVKQRTLVIIEKGDFILERLDAWSNFEDAFLCRYEDLFTNTTEVLRNLSTNVGLPFSERRARLALRTSNFRKMSGRDSGEEDNSSFYRKGIVGDWHNVFDGEVLEALEIAKGGRWSKLIERLQY